MYSVDDDDVVVDPCIAVIETQIHMPIADNCLNNFNIIIFLYFFIFKYYGRLMKIMQV